MAIVVDIRDPQVALPAYLLVDTSMLLKARCVPGRPPSQVAGAALSFLHRVNQLTSMGQLIAMVSILSMEECYFKLISWRYEKEPSLAQERLAAAVRLGRLPAQVGWHELYKSSPHLIPRWSGEVDTFALWVQGIPLTVLEPEELLVAGAVASIESRMRHYMSIAQILPKDAYFVALAERLGVLHIATLDSDFRRLDSSFTLYTIP